MSQNKVKEQRYKSKTYVLHSSSHLHDLFKKTNLKLSFYQTSDLISCFFISGLGKGRYHQWVNCMIGVVTLWRAR